MNQTMAAPSWLPKDFGLERIVETHISYVFIGRSTVFKQRKQIVLPFIDNRSLEQRYQHACDEVTLNSRLSPTIYLGVRPLIAAAEEVILAEPCALGSSLPINCLDVIVEMKRLQDEDCLTEQLTHPGISSIVMQVGSFLADFHRASPSLGNCESHTREFFAAAKENTHFLNDVMAVGREEVKENSRKLLEYVENSISRLQPLISERCRQGHFIDGHGDLRVEHIFAQQSGIAVIDCVEFSHALRKGDTANDIAFLSMDLTFREQPALAQALLSAYLRNQAPIPQTLFRYYCVYRALVRAKVSWIQELNCEQNSNCTRLLGLARRYSEALDVPFVIAIGGYMGTGKSTLSRSLAQLLSFAHLHTDGIRRQSGVADRNASFGEGDYTDASRLEVYRCMFSQAEVLLQRGNTVVLDATFSRHQQRSAAQALAARYGAEFLFVNCVLPVEMIRSRLDARATEGSSESDGRVGLLQQHIENYELPDSTELPYSLQVDTSLPLCDQRRIVIEGLKCGHAYDE